MLLRAMLAAAYADTPLLRYSGDASCAMSARAAAEIARARERYAALHDTRLQRVDMRICYAMLLRHAFFHVDAADADVATLLPCRCYCCCRCHFRRALPPADMPIFTLDTTRCLICCYLRC